MTADLSLLDFPLAGRSFSTTRTGRRSSARSSWRSRGAFAAAALSLSLFAPSAMAQDKAVAESLFNSGKAAMEAGDYKKACKSFAESQRQDPSVGTLLNLGRCNELQGRLATAWGHYKEAARMAQLKGDAERSDAARKLATEMEPKLSKLTVNAAAPAAGMVVARIRKDGAETERVEIGSGALGLAVDVDPGAYTIEASAPGFKTWTGEITVGATADKKTVDIPALETAPEGATVPPVTGGPATTTPSDSGGGSDGSGLMTAGFIVGGVGVVGIGLGAIFGLSASGTASDAEEDPALCPDKQCTTAGLDEIDSAKSSATISTIAFGVGAAALVGGAVLVILGATSGGGGSETGGATAPLALTPVASAEGGGLWLDGSF